MQKKTNLHIGKMICQKMKEEGRSKKWLADKVFCEYSCFCKMLKKPFLDTELLLRISLALHYDFFAPLSKYIAEKQQK
jgi:hypothetical protein